MIEAVLFDLFETLVTENDGAILPSLAVAERLGVDGDAFRAEWRKRLRARMTGAFSGYASAVTDVCEALSHPADHDLIRQIESERTAGFARVFASPDPALLRALQAMNESGVRMGVVSNTSHDEIGTYEESWLSELMDISVFSCNVGCMKPEREIYLIACERLGAAPDTCIYVGDGGFDELPTAMALGMTTYCATWSRDRWPDQTSGNPGSAPCPKLSAPSELPKVVKKALGEPEH